MVLRIKTKDGDFLPVAYESRKLTPNEQCYLIYNKELVALVHCLRKWRCYLEGPKEFTALTDHKSLVHFATQKHLFRRQAEWLEVLQQYIMKIMYKPGKDLKMADALSRLYPKTIFIRQSNLTGLSYCKESQKMVSLATP